MTHCKRNLTAEEHAELEELNASVNNALEKRTAWLDAKILEVSSFALGDEIFDMSNGRLLGTVTDIQRFHRGHAEFDNSVSFYYTYKMAGSGNSYDNTSRQYTRVGTKKDYADKLRRELDSIENENKAAVIRQNQLQVDEIGDD